MTAADVPDWAKLPPLAPLLPEMPFVVSQHFDESLVSWQSPERFVGALGHSISDSAPSGVVEAMTVLTPRPATQPEAGSRRAVSDEPLTLAVPPVAVPPVAGTGPEVNRLGRVPSRSIGLSPGEATPFSVEAPASTGTTGPAEEEVRAGPAPIEPEPVSSLSSGRPAPGFREDRPPPSVEVAESPPTSHLVGSAPLAPAVQPLVVSQPTGGPRNRLVHAPTPPDMPLAHLPSALLAKDRADELPAPADPVDATESAVDRQESNLEPPPAPAPSAAPPPESAIPATRGLVGERAMVPEPPDPGSSFVAALPSAEPLEVPSRDLPLASPPSVSPTTEFPLLGGERPLGSDEGRPPVTDAPDRTPPPPPTDDPSPEGDGSSTTVPVAHLPWPAPPTDEPAPVAPLVGDTPPIAGAPMPPMAEADDVARSGTEPVEPALPVVASRPPAVPRVGLGEPMAKLPPSATSWDITTMSRAQQVQASRSLIRHQLAVTAGSGGPLGQPLTPALTQPMAAPLAPRGPSPAEPPATVFAGTPLPRATLENIGPPPSGVSPRELAPASPEQAPLLSMDPLFGGEPTEAGSLRSAPPPEGLRVRATVGARHGVDLTNVPVDRSGAGATEVRRMQARAFTSDRAIVIPSDAGSLEAGPGEALFAHELTHVAQQARFGPNLPPEFTPAGRLLEAEALAAEMALAPTPLSPLEPPSDRSKPLPLAASPSGGADPDSLAASILDKMSVLSTPAPAAGATAVFTPTGSSSPSTAPAPAPAPMGGGMQRAEDLVPTAASAAQPVTAPEDQDGHFANRPSDQELTNLSLWLYPLIRYRLKGELREDRERAGLLTEHYRRW